MSTLLPSLSDRPFVTSGTAVAPPDPVLVATPLPSRLNQASIVNVAAPSPGAAPNVTYELLPPKSIALFVVVALTIAVNVSLPVSAPSLALSISTYVPALENVAVVAHSFGCANVTVPGPLTLLHVAMGSPPGNPSSVTVPASAACAGSVMVWSGPALTIGARLTVPGLTWIVTASLPADSPS